MTKPKAKPKQGVYSVRDCNYSYCIHYSEERRRCSRRRCFYDPNSAGSELDEPFRRGRKAVWN